MALEIDPLRPRPLSALFDALAGDVAPAFDAAESRGSRRARPRDDDSDTPPSDGGSRDSNDAAAAQLRALERIEALLAELVRRHEPPHAPPAAVFAWPEN